MKSSKSAKLFERAKKVIPGGVNSPVRAFKSVGLTPPFMEKAKGAYIWDIDNNKYIDYIGSWGPMILGQAHASLLSHIQKRAKRGTSFGAPTALEVQMAELICGIMPSIEMVRMVNSGSEATMSAVRLARAYTGRDKIIKFEGCYHGHADSFLIKAGSGAATLGIPDSPGVPKGVAQDTLTAIYNDLDSVRRLINENSNAIAAIIVEPVVGNMGCVPPAAGFLEGLREICAAHKIIFIMDEVMTGFRVALGGAQSLYNIKPDLTTLGKIIGGGLPVGAYGGKREIMEMVAPAGPMYQAGTLSGNPIAMAAGYSMISTLRRNPSLYKKLERSSGDLEKGIRGNLKSLGLKFKINRVGSMFTLFFTEQEVRNYDDAKTTDTAMFAKYYGEMLNRGIYLPPSQFEAAFVSTAHSRRDIEKTINANYEALKSVIE
ncbi:MAG: glutamate-1-semialdehyde 2,1-aminomutase [Bacteroidota bacterium]